jgi:hypothetical protein
MSKTTKSANMTTIHANREGGVSFANEVDSVLVRRKACVVVVTDNAKKTVFDFKRDEQNLIKRLFILFEGKPIHLDDMNSWREWAMNSHPQLWDLRMAFVEKNSGIEHIEKMVREHCANWFDEIPPAEHPGIELGQWVQMPKVKKSKDDPSLLTMMFGSMGELLTGLELAARRFKEAAGHRSNGEERQKYLDHISQLLAETNPLSPTPKSDRMTNREPNLGLGNVTADIPKVLLLGKTGVGKTLIASYLGERCGFSGIKPVHISIPEFLNKEDMFEYALFGYAGGAYSGGKPEGDRGLLLENVCRVVFLDEIGEASPTIQAKLLTFLDHFQVRPRGWTEQPFYCPVLVVAATNQNVREEVNGAPRLRSDLLARFTDVLPIPLLKDRKQDFEFILDCLLQRHHFNPNQFVKEIGANALSFLKSQDFEDGNFRELENLFREACKRAHCQNRGYLVQSDFKKPA